MFSFFLKEKKMKSFRYFPQFFDLERDKKKMTGIPYNENVKLYYFYSSTQNIFLSNHFESSCRLGTQYADVNKTEIDTVF